MSSIAASKSLRNQYRENKRKLVIAFDVGTTYSGISYAILEPDREPQVHGITHFPGQENVGGDCKIPTIMYYDHTGKLRAAGAEAKAQEIEELAAEGDWFKAEWFKLHLRPKMLDASHLTDAIRQLPPGKTAVAVFADFLRYLHKCARSYIEERYPHGATLWQNLEPEAHYILTHPNGWEGAQQSQMRRAAVIANLICDDIKGQSRISFLTEGEASLHYCIGSDLTAEACKSTSKGILVVDAGGGTIDISSYKYVPRSGYEEMSIPQCHLQGSVMVTARLEDLLKKLLRGSKFCNSVKYISECFDTSAKHLFRSELQPPYINIRFGSPNDQEEKFDIRRGQLRLSGADIASCFSSSVECIINAIEQQKHNIKTVFLVGGFSASPYLFNKIKDRFSGTGLAICRPDPTRVNKAVAEGAISFHLNGYVTSRVARFDYGKVCWVKYSASDPSHRSRAEEIDADCIGTPILHGFFDRIIAKGTKVKNTRHFQCSYYEPSLAKRKLAKIEAEIVCYRGNLERVNWIDEDPDMFDTLCTVKADTSDMLNSLKPKHRKSKGATLTYFQLSYDVVLTFGATELTAHLEWEDKGVLKSSPATLVYDLDEDMPMESRSSDYESDDEPQFTRNH